MLEGNMNWQGALLYFANGVSNVSFSTRGLIWSVLSGLWCYEQSKRDEPRDEFFAQM